VSKKPGSINAALMPDEVRPLQIPVDHGSGLAHPPHGKLGGDVHLELATHTC
jgi:hypothetical protein